MRKKRVPYGYRNFRHAQERRMYYAHKDLVHIRGNRSPKMLPDPWDDIYYCDQKTWKATRKTQYRDRSELNKYSIELQPYDYDRYLSEYFKDHDIPYRLEKYDYWSPKLVTYWAKKEVPQKYIDRLLWRCWTLWRYQ